MAQTVSPAIIYSYLLLTRHPPYSALVTSCTQQLLQRTLKHDRHSQTGLALVSQVLTSMIFHCTRDDDYMRGVADLATAFDGMWHP